MADGTHETDLISLTTEIVSAFVANNPIKSSEVARLIQETHGALAGLRNEPTPEAPAEPAFKPAVSVRKSLASREHIISLIDGKPYRVLTRHLKAHGLTPAAYRERYGLPKTYPVVAPAFADMRRALAIKIGLGNKRRPGKAKKSQTGTQATPAPQKRGRPRKPKA